MAHDVGNDDDAATSCATCRFWRQRAVDARGPDWGECRRMPPALPPIEEEKLLHVGLWPHTAGDDWCGEWQSAGNLGSDPGGPERAVTPGP